MGREIGNFAEGGGFFLLNGLNLTISDFDQSFFRAKTSIL